eukprot:TRINITY_DN6110_c0_g1_i3.p1 TRINITY_DN6110_c0_g1~~TRINITY_DN6110_c0_g1_i3.p1  ORF type:complete len:274 (+),score=29.36 TRINITY_DN6110_c0_g1_i3:65-886(+)
MKASTAVAWLLSAVGVAGKSSQPLSRKATCASSQRQQSTSSSRSTRAVTLVRNAGMGNASSQRRRSTSSSRSTSAATPERSPEQGNVADDRRKVPQLHSDRPEDLDLVARFCELSEVPQDASYPEQFGLMLKLVTVLRLTPLCHEEMLSILALAAIYFREAVKLDSELSGPQFIGCALVLCAFLGQCHLIDEAGTLKEWHILLLNEEWSLEELNKLLLRLLTMRDCVLRVRNWKFKTAVAALRAESNSRPMSVRPDLELRGSNDVIRFSVYSV